MMKLRLKYFIFIIYIFASSNLNSLEKNYYAEGKQLFDENRLNDAKFKFEKDIVFNPKSEKSYMYLAKIFNQKEEDILERVNLNAVILLNPKNEEAIFYLIKLNIKQSNFEKAENLLSQFNLVCKNFCDKKKELKKKLDNLDNK